MPAETVTTTTGGPVAGELHRTLAGLDALELAGARTERFGRRLWRAAWP